jgi:hypothetical protein
VSPSDSQALEVVLQAEYAPIDLARHWVAPACHQTLKSSESWTEWSTGNRNFRQVNESKLSIFLHLSGSIEISAAVEVVDQLPHERSWVHDLKEETP